MSGSPAIVLLRHLAQRSGADIGAVSAAVSALRRANAMRAYPPHALPAEAVARMNGYALAAESIAAARAA